MKINQINNYKFNRNQKQNTKISPGFNGVKLKANLDSFERILQEKGYASKMSRSEIQALKDSLWLHIENLNDTIAHTVIPNVLHYDYNDELFEEDIWKNGEDSIVDYTLNDLEKGGFFDRVKRAFSRNQIDRAEAENIVNIVRKEISKKLNSAKAQEAHSFVQDDEYVDFVEIKTSSTNNLTEKEIIERQKAEDEQTHQRIMSQLNLLHKDAKRELRNTTIFLLTLLGAIGALGVWALNKADFKPEKVENKIETKESLKKAQEDIDFVEEYNQQI